MVKKTQIVILSLLISCSSILEPEEQPKEELILNLYMNLPYTDDGYYLFDYPNGSPHTYTSVHSISEPMKRIFWGSPDSFYVQHQFHIFGEPIANYSTYTSSDSTSRRLVYVYQPHIGDTLEVYGCIYGDGDDYLCKQISFIVTE